MNVMDIKDAVANTVTDKVVPTAKKYGLLLAGFLGAFIVGEHVESKRTVSTAEYSIQAVYVTTKDPNEKE